MAATTTSHFRRSGRGRGARRPGEVPARGLMDVAVRLKDDLKHDDVPLLAAGVAFYALLALVPALVALVSVYGLVANPADIERNVDDELAAAPTEVGNLVQSQLEAIVDSSPSGLRIGALVGLAVALWSASSGMKNLMTAVNRAYHEEESRGFLKLRLMSLLLTLGSMVLGAVAVFALLVAPSSLDRDGAQGTVRSVVEIVRWPVLALVVIVGLAVLYRFGPDRDGARWRWISPGAVLATVVWLAASVGFSIYTANFGQYNETYGALGAVVVVMLWLWLGAYAVIAGAELNGEMERQTVVDTTRGEVEALGERDAYAADTVGPPADAR
jgi:membrane protein